MAASTMTARTCRSWSTPQCACTWTALTARCAGQVVMLWRAGLAACLQACVASPGTPVYDFFLHCRSGRSGWRRDSSTVSRQGCATPAVLPVAATTSACLSCSWRSGVASCLCLQQPPRRFHNQSDHSEKRRRGLQHAQHAAAHSAGALGCSSACHPRCTSPCCLVDGPQLALASC